MAAFTVEQSIAAPSGLVWACLSDVAQWPVWLPTVADVQPLDAPVLATGARFRILQPRLRPAVWTVTAFDPPASFTWESARAGLRVIARHVLTEVDERNTRLELSIAFEGLAGAIAGLTAGALARDYLEKEAVALKRLAEGCRLT